MFAQSLSVPESKRSIVEIDVDISTLKPGAILVVDKLDVPVLILRRTPEMLASLAKTANFLDDPWSLRSGLPDGMDPNVRSVSPEYFVFSPLFRFVNANSGRQGLLAVEHFPATAGPVVFANSAGAWLGGFRDTAGMGLHFDYAGRGFRFQHFQWLKVVDNIEVPSHKFLTPTTLRINVGLIAADPTQLPSVSPQSQDKTRR